jgi:hypothetical protein
MRIPRTSLVIVLMAASALFGGACGGSGDDPEPTPTSEPTAEPTTSPADLASAVVQIVALDAARAPVWSGSGTIVSSDGLIVTNAHVVDDRTDEYLELGVALTEGTDTPPEPTYLAEIAAVDYALDLAVVRIVSDLDGAAADASLPTVPIGDSDAVEIGDNVRILGYPGIGGETITFTQGTVSGFTAQRDVDERAWIKTDATISGGNSGGLAANAAGEIIGIPTIAGSGADDDEPVDCRFVVDTNRDGSIDELDTCVPVGGLINGLRPVALALPLIEAAEAGEAYVSTLPEPGVGQPEGFDPANVTFRDVVFSPDVTDTDEPTEVVPFFPTGTTDVCAFWDYEGMVDGVTWEALWFVDGVLDESGSITDNTWSGGASGNWWVCIYDDAGLPDGLYELTLAVEGETQISESVFVGGDHPVVEIAIDNQLAVGVCFVQASPSGAANWGQDELGNQEVIESGGTITLFLPAGIYDLRALDCDANTLFEEYELDFTTATTLTLS